MLAEGVYLGPRIVGKLYDLTARRYESIKQFDPYYERMLLGEPLAAALLHFRSPLLLDIATGTARLPRALADSGLFRGRVVGLDRARGMLRTAAALLPEGQRPPLLQADALRLPFADATFDAVSCVESLEFLPSLEAGLAEMARVLRPGGMLLITNRKGGARWYMPGHILSTPALLALLERHGFERISVQRWQVSYDLVFARLG